MSEPKWLTPEIKEKMNVTITYDRGYRITKLTPKTQPKQLGHPQDMLSHPFCSPFSHREAGVRQAAADQKER